MCAFVCKVVVGGRQGGQGGQGWCDLSCAAQASALEFLRHQSEVRPIWGHVRHVRPAARQHAGTATDRQVLPSHLRGGKGLGLGLRVWVIGSVSLVCAHHLDELASVGVGPDGSAVAGRPVRAHVPSLVVARPRRHRVHQAIAEVWKSLGINRPIRICAMFICYVYAYVIGSGYGHNH